MVKIVLIWLMCVIVVSVLWGELEHQKTKKVKKTFKSSQKHEEETCDFKFENIDLYPMLSLQSRGSWRIAQGNVFGKTNFFQMKREEYNKKL